MVYFIGNLDARLVKIGHTDRDVEERLKELQTGCPYPLAVFLELPGGAREERDFHQAWPHLRAHGEWFKLEGELRTFLAFMQPMMGCIFAAFAPFLERIERLEYDVRVMQVAMGMFAKDIQATFGSVSDSADAA